MDIRSANAAQAYAQLLKTAPQSQDPLAETAQRAAQSFADTLRQGEATAQSAMTGGADPQSLVFALSQTELAVETAVTLRDKVVEAYQEILRMPV